MRKQVWLLVVLLTVGLSACKDPQPKYGRDFNQERKKIGLPIIPDNWELMRATTDYSKWGDPEHREKLKARVSFHRSKVVIDRNGILTHEQDEYYGKQDYTNFEGTVAREELLITYYYRVDEGDYMKRLGWDAFVFT